MTKQTDSSRVAKGARKGEVQGEGKGMRSLASRTNYRSRDSESKHGRAQVMGSWRKLQGTWLLGISWSYVRKLNSKALYS